MKKRVVILGSTGSVGRSALQVIASHPERFQVVGLAASRSHELLQRQCREFSPRVVALAEPQAARRLRRSLDIPVLEGPEGVQAVASLEEAELVVSAIVGSAGLMPTLAAIRAGKDIALANKEALVMAGPLVLAEAMSRGVRLLPVDSEHSALMQCLEGRPASQVRTLVLTASGGPFMGMSAEELREVSPQEALRHPRWRMGRKITIDSATLMNKGLEVIEAHYLFGIPAERIKVLVHPQSIVHSMVELVDGSVLALLSVPDMRGPVAYALSWPERLPGGLRPLGVEDLQSLTFHAPDEDNFPCLRCAYEALRAGGTMPAVLNAANEVAVRAFLREEISFTRIAEVIREVMAEHSPTEPQDIQDVLRASAWAQQRAQALVATLRGGGG